jgi:hypothetical protein
LAPFDLDLAFVGRFPQSSERPVRLSFGIRQHQRPRGRADDRARRRTFCESKDLALFRFGQARLAPGAGTITQPVDPLSGEAPKAFAHGLGMAAQFLGNCGGPPPLPAADNHACAANPIARRVPTLS